jgi:hypothetical protein
VKYPLITSCFTPLGEPIEVLDTLTFAWDSSAKLTSITTATTVQLSLDQTKFEVQNCHSVLHQFGLDASVYQALMQRYSQTALAFPIQTISFQPMNGNLARKTGISCTLTTTPRFVDTIFILFPQSNKHRTCYINPMLSEWSLKMGGYGQIPDLVSI